jgi:putative sigma-54 modulation protein
MPTHIVCRNFELTDAIRTYVEEKISHLKKQEERIQTVDVECDRNMHHKKGDVFHVRMNVQVPGELLHAEADAQGLYAGIDVCRDQIAEQLRKQKEKRETLKRETRKTRRNLKSILTFWKSE